MIFTDEQRKEIAAEGYEEHTVGSPVIVKDSNSKFFIGYVSQIEDSISGFQAYVVTDVKLPLILPRQTMLRSSMSPCCTGALLAQTSGRNTQ
nr:hypothetical protein [Streptococcus equi]